MVCKDEARAKIVPIGVQEYITILIKESRLTWRKPESGDWFDVAPAPDGLLRRSMFRGLWLDSAALLRKDIPRIVEALQRGFESPEHREFIEKLAARKFGSR